MNPQLNDIINHVRNHEYMSGVEREKLRTKATGEVFTPTELVQEILDKLDQTLFRDPTKTFLDPTCGDGQFLSEVLIRKVENGIDFETALSTIYGADLMLDNCIECIKRLYMVTESNIKILEGSDIPKQWKRDGLTAVFEVNGKIANIVCADGLVYDYSFGEAPTDTFASLFEFD